MPTTTTLHLQLDREVIRLAKIQAIKQGVTTAKYVAKLIVADDTAAAARKGGA